MEKITMTIKEFKRIAKLTSRTMEKTHLDFCKGICFTGEKVLATNGYQLGVKFYDTIQKNIDANSRYTIHSKDIKKILGMIEKNNTTIEIQFQDRKTYPLEGISDSYSCLPSLKTAKIFIDSVEKIYCWAIEEYVSEKMLKEFCEISSICSVYAFAEDFSSLSARSDNEIKFINKNCILMLVDEKNNKDTVIDSPIIEGENFRVLFNGKYFKNIINDYKKKDDIKVMIQELYKPLHIQKIDCKDFDILLPIREVAR